MRRLLRPLWFLTVMVLASCSAPQRGRSPSGETAATKEDAAQVRGVSGFSGCAALAGEGADAPRPLEKLRALLDDLPGQDGRAARVTVAAFLCTLAKGLEPGSRDVEEIREHAGALVQLEPLSLQHSDQVRAGLDAAVRALCQQYDRHARPGDAQWLASATRAVSRVAVLPPFELQRAAIQDGLRTVTVAYAHLLEASPGDVR